MINVNDFRTGVTIEQDGSIWTVVEFQHVKPGKGAAFVRTTLKNLQTGTTVERKFNAGEVVPRAHLEKREMQFLYSQGDEYVFMDTENYEQQTLSQVQLGDQRWYLLENMLVNIISWNGNLIGVELPNTVELEVVETEPGFRGDTATGVTKPAKLQTGYEVKVPLFINVGDKVKVDTRTGAYLGRA